MGKVENSTVIYSFIRGKAKQPSKKQKVVVVYPHNKRLHYPNLNRERTISSYECAHTICIFQRQSHNDRRGNERGLKMACLKTSSLVGSTTQQGHLTC